jgi:flagellar hook assembly protein FlgD
MPIPQYFTALQNYPNPFNPSTNISFTLPSAQQVRLEVFDILGRRVRMLADQRFEAGQHTITWDGNNQNRAEAPSGVYFYRLSGDGIDEARKMVLLR